MIVPSAVLEGAGQAATDMGHATSATATIGIISFALMLLLPLLVYYPLCYVGYSNTFRQLLVNGDARVTSNMFSNTFKGYWRNVWGGFLMMLFTYLWMLLLIVPGIIKAFAYSMTPYILKDYPELSANQAINLSIKMMKGHKFDYFYLQLSFIGWGLLSILTLGIGYIWLMPYMYASMAAFYEDIKNDYINKTTNL
ncbi:MAG: DUF975 family protein [Bacteroidales bacterium]|nr:DUF975 family protein [Bacteroidales bacterium]